MTEPRFPAGLQITDSQVHLVPASTQARPWNTGVATFHGWSEFDVARMLREMDAAGVGHAVVVPTSAVDGLRNDYALAAARAHPDRFSVVGLIDIAHRELAQPMLDGWRGIAGLVGIRAIFRPGVGASAGWLADGTADWFWAAAEAAGVPLYVHAPGQVRRLDPIARAHPRLRMVIDHLGMSADVRPDEIDASISDVIALARHPNVAAKASALTCITPSKFPAERLRVRLKEVLQAYGAQRVFWGSDITRLSCTYRQSIETFVESVSFLSDDDIRGVMGRSLATWLALPASVPIPVPASLAAANAAEPRS